MFVAQQRVHSTRPDPIQYVSSDSQVIVTHVAWAARRIPLKKGSIRGFHPGRPGCAGIQFESLLECDVIGAVLSYPQVIAVHSQPFTIYYECDGRKHRYTPDLLVELSVVPDALAARGFDRLTVIECKPREKLPHCNDELRRARAAIGECMSAPFVAVTDRALTVAPWAEVSYDA